MSARKHLHALELDSMETSKEMTKRIVIIIKDAINKERQLYEVCKTIKDNCGLKFGGVWQCKAIYDGIGSYCFVIDKSFYVSLQFGKLRIIVNKVYDEVSVSTLDFVNLTNISYSITVKLILRSNISQKIY